jgi:hypothetical protein
LTLEIFEEGKESNAAPRRGKTGVRTRPVMAFDQARRRILK